MRVTDPGSWVSGANVPVYVIRLRGSFRCMGCFGMAAGMPIETITMTIDSSGGVLSFGTENSGDLAALGPVGTFNL